jgi:hypothetical protein
MLEHLKMLYGQFTKKRIKVWNLKEKNFLIEWTVT